MRNMNNWQGKRERVRHRADKIEKITTRERIAVHARKRLNENIDNETHTKLGEN